jgi:hypothetical protein
LVTAAFGAVAGVLASPGPDDRAAEEGDLEGLEELLAHDVVLRGDGGGKAPALARAVHGRALGGRGDGE